MAVSKSKRVYLIANEELMKSWDWEANEAEGLDPSKLSDKSKKEGHWICEKGHRWPAKIYTRTQRGYGCPYCSGRLPIQGETDLKTRFPDVASQWDYDKNAPLRPEDVTPFSHTEVWWKCDYKHSWPARIGNRVALDRGCPYCSGRLPIKGVNDLETLHPQLASEWNYEKNRGKSPSDYKPQSNKEVWWTCERKHDYPAVIAARVMRDQGCPICCNRQVLVGFNDLATVRPEIAAQWDYEKNKNLTPYDVTAGSTKDVWWVCEVGHSWPAKVYSRCSQNTGCSVCNSTRQRSFPEASIIFYLSQIYEEVEANAHFDWLPNMEIDIFLPRQRIGIEYDGSAWHKNAEKDNRKNAICRENNVRLIRMREPRCPEVDGEKIMLPSFSKADLEEGLNVLLKMLGVSFDINLKQDEHDIRLLMDEADIQNSLQERYPDIAREWHPTKNGRLKPSMVSYSSGRNVWWKGDCGHEWDAFVYSRLGGTGCPYCSNHRHPLIFCKENGKTYEKYDEVAKDLGVSIASVSLVVNGKQKSVKGYHLCFLDSNQ